MSLRLRWTGAALVALVCTRAHAQVHSGPAGYRQLTAAQVAESLTVLHQLETVVRKSPDSAAAWFHRGMLAWTLAARDNVPPPVHGIDWTLLGHMADTSLRRAAAAAPEHVEYQLASGRYLAASFGPVNRTASAVLYNTAARRARTIADPPLHAQAALEVGRLYFRFYDSKEHVVIDDPNVNLLVKGGPPGMPPPSIEEVSAVLNRALTARDFSGEDSYLKAESLFNEASAADPGSGGAFRALAMTYVARNRWPDLLALGRGRVRTDSWDAWAWMAIGLATQRLGDPNTPAVAFDSALTRLDSASRHRLDHVERIMRPADSIRFAQMTPQFYEANTTMYWLLSDPLWSVRGNEPRTEFLARLAYAEFRWSNPELDVIGTESDRGRTYVRYGAPMSIMTDNTTSDAAGRPQFGSIGSTWIYNNGVGLVDFRGFERLEYTNPDVITSLINDTPVRWPTVPKIRIDSMPSQMARFRTNSDSVDVIVAITAPATEIQRSSNITTNALASVWVMQGGLRRVAFDSIRMADDRTSVFRHRVAKGSYAVRLEASAEGATSAARSVAVLNTGEDPSTGFTTRGFGMSDVLLTAQSESKVPAPKRWTDFSVVPTTGAVQRGGELSLLWENYDLAAENGGARYTVTITIERERSQSGRIAAAVLRGIAGSVGVSETPDRMELTFSRAQAHAAAIVENIGLSLGDTPAGSYKLTVKVVDEVAGRATAWSSGLVVVP